MKDEENPLAGWKGGTPPQLQWMTDLAVRRMQGGISQKEYLTLFYENAKRMSEQSERGRKAMGDALDKLKLLIADASEPGDEITEEIGQEAEAWLNNPGKNPSTS